MTNPELDWQISSGFDDPDSIAPNNLGWTRDPSKGYSKVGSAKVIADGKMHALAGNKISVVTGQQLNLSARCQYVNLSGTGTPLQLWVRFNNGQDVMISFVSANSGTSSGWVHISGSVTVPVNATLAWTRVIVDKSATAGTIWWDEIPDRKGSTALARSWVDSLDGMLDSIANLFNWPGAVDLLGGDPTQAWEQAVDQFLGPLRVFVSFEFWDNLSTLWDTFFNFCFGQATQAALTNAWNTVLGDFDIPPPANMAAVIPNALNNWSVQIAQATVSGLDDINMWLRNIIEDATIVFGDGLHWTYALGNVNDAVDRIWTTAGTGYGKRTWYAAWNRLMQALGWAKSAAPSAVQPNDIGAKFVETDSAVGTAQATGQAIADGIHQAINHDTATGTDKTVAAVKGNLTAIPPKNITTHDYAIITFEDVSFTLPDGSAVYLPYGDITNAQAAGDSIGASATKGLWLAEPGLYAMEIIATISSNAGLSASASLMPLLIWGDTAPPSSGTWTGSHTLPCGTSVTITDQNITYSMCGSHLYVRTDTGNRYFLPGVTFDDSSATSSYTTIHALIMTAVKISS